MTAVNLTATTLRGPNTLVLYSTAPGRIALDGPPGDNSPFAAAFLEELSKPSVDLKALVPGLRRGLLLRTNGRQVIWDESTLGASHVLTRRQGPARITPAATAQVMELPKAYAFALEKKLSLPAGLAAIRSPAGNTSDVRLGSYVSSIKIKFGTANVPAVSIEPLIVIVLAIDEGGLAQAIVSSRLHNMEQAGSAWGLIPARVTGNELEFMGHAQIKMRWKDPNSGTIDVGDGWLTVPSIDSFRRLD